MRVDRGEKKYKLMRKCNDFINITNTFKRLIDFIVSNDISWYHINTNVRLFSRI